MTVWGQITVINIRCDRKCCIESAGTRDVSSRDPRKKKLLSGRSQIGKLGSLTQWSFFLLSVKKPIIVEPLHIAWHFGWLQSVLLKCKKSFTISWTDSLSVNSNGCEPCPLGSISVVPAGLIDGREPPASLEATHYAFHSAWSLRHIEAIGDKLQLVCLCTGTYYGFYVSY